MQSSSSEDPSQSIYEDPDAVTNPHGNGFPAERLHPVRPPPKPPVDRRQKPSLYGPSPVKPPTPGAGEAPPRPRPPASFHRSCASSVASLQCETSPPPLPTSPPPPLPSFLQTHCPSYVDVLPDDTSSLRTASLYQSYSSHQLNLDDDVTVQLRWLRRLSKSDFLNLTSLYRLDVQEEVRLFNQRAINLRRAIYLYKLLMAQSKDRLQNIISEFRSISGTVDKAKQKSKNMGIAGGATGAVGGVTAVVGIALAPVTMGISLVATAVGAGMVAGAGGMGAHAVKAKKKMVDRTTVEGLVDNYRMDVVDLEMCLDLILCGMNELRRLDLARLHRAGALVEAVRTAHLAQDVYAKITDTRTPAHTGGTPSERLLQTFTKDMDQYFTENKNQKLKASNKSKFSGRVELLACNLQEELDHLEHMCTMFT